MRWIAMVAALLLVPLAYAADVGQVKTLKGTAHIERAGQQIPVALGLKVEQSDTIVTGPNSTVGITFSDNSRISAGPSTVLSIEKYAFDSTTNVGNFDASIKKGTLAVVSGKMVKQTPGSMRIRTPASIMGVRGTEFVVKVADASNN